MKTVLIIEDNLEIRENTAEILELAGFKVINAENGKVGLTMAERSKPDIILCDIMMPEVNGYEVIRELKMATGTGKTLPAKFDFLSLVARASYKNLLFKFLHLF